MQKKNLILLPVNNTFFDGFTLFSDKLLKKVKKLVLHQIRSIFEIANGYNLGLNMSGSDLRLIGCKNFSLFYNTLLLATFIKNSE